jgi:TetR/AcrR family transcriptional regulator
LAIQQRNPVVTKESLLNAAAELIARSGYEGTTTEAIARRAGVNKAMISYHFGGKRGLYGALLSSILMAIGSRLEAVQAWEAPPEQRLAAFIAAFREMIRIQPVAPQIMLREAVSGGRYVDKKLLPHFLRAFAVLQDILEQGVREGKFRPVNPVLTQVGLVGSLMFFFATETFRKRVVRELGAEPGPMEAEDYIRHWRDMMLGGLTIRTASGATVEADAGAPSGSPRSGSTRGDQR